ncbi:hypothetical protein HLB02_17405 [Serratia nevei]|uniref:hypothetical protein n=1 Tax=Serratia TaxID=613 RepID=UPI0013DC3622|nr:hypothetical protein [Serratia marcescens]MBL0875155.1 hypothetical protein [Serratia nevei]MDP8622993.1 hypothetical protein [Serratia marcescens]
MNILGITTSPKSRQLFASDWKYHRSALVLRIIEHVLSAMLLGFLAVMGLMGIAMIAQPVLNGADTLFTHHLAPDVLAANLFELTLMALFAGTYILLMKFSRDYYRAAVLGFASIVDFDADFSPRARLRALHAGQQAATDGGRDDA